MDPGGILAALVHDDGVRLVPLVLARPPQCCQRRREAGGRLCLGEGTFELRQIHRETLGKQTTTSARAKTARPPARRRERARTASPRRLDGRRAEARAATPSADTPRETKLPATPAMFTVTVNTSLRYISIGSAAPFSPIPKAADGVAGARIASTPSAKTFSKSRLISVRTFCARK